MFGRKPTLAPQAQPVPDAEEPAGWEVRAGALALAPASAPPLASHDAASRRPRRLVRVLAWLALGAGVLLLGDAVATVLWQEPVTALYTELRQESLRGDLAALDRAAPAGSALAALARLSDEPKRIAYLATELENHARSGAAVGRIRIPAIKANFVVVKGTSTSALRNGPGIYPETAFPGTSGTTAIAGHRTTYLAPFRHIDALRRGETILIDMPYGTFTYRVTGSRVVLPTAVWVIDPVGYQQLVLSACTPLFSASHRIVVFARLASILPRGAARLPGVSNREVLSGAVTGASPPAAAGSRPQVLKAVQRLPLSLVV